MIIDSQVHVWTPETPERPWPKDGKQREHLPYALTYEKMLTLMDEAEVERAIIVPPSWEGDRNDYALEAARLHPDRFAVMGRIGIDDVQAPAQVARWLTNPGMLGIRLNFTPKLVQPLRQGYAEWLWTLAEDLQIPIMAHTAIVMPEFMKIVSSHPKLRLIIDHMGLSSEIARQNRREEALDRTLDFAAFPNVAVKLSNAPVYSSENYPFSDMFPFIQKLIGAFGKKRCFWGSDVSHSLKYATYQQSVTQFTDEITFLTDDEKTWIMGRGISEYLGWRI